MGLTLQERETTLAEPLVGVIAIPREAGRGPLTVPIWYQYEPGGRIWLLTGRESAKAAGMPVGAVVSLCVQRLEPTIRYVTAEATVVSIQPEASGEMAAMAERYLSGEALDGYLRMAREQLPEHIRIDLDVQRWLSADLGSV